MPLARLGYDRFDLRSSSLPTHLLTRRARYQAQRGWRVVALTETATVTTPQQQTTEIRSGHEPVTVTIPEPFITRALYVVAAMLVAAHMVFSINRYMLHYQFFGADNLYVLFDLWDEVSIPSWYSVSLLLVCSAVLSVIAVAKWQRGDRFRVHWIGLAFMFLTLSVDDAADIHGHTSYKLDEMLDTGGFLAYAWVIPAVFLVVAVGLFFVRFVLHLPPRTRTRYVVAGALFLAGALGMEMIQARYDTLHGVENMRYRIMVAVEEGLEMSGTILFLSASLRYLAGLSDGVRLRIDHGG